MDSSGIEEKNAVKDSSEAVTYRGTPVKGALLEGTLDPTYGRKATVLNEAVSPPQPECLGAIAQSKTHRFRISALDGTNGNCSLL